MASITVVLENNDFTDSLQAQSYKWEMPLETQAQWDQRNTLHGSSPTNHQIEANSSLQTQAGRLFFFPRPKLPKNE